MTRKRPKHVLPACRFRVNLETKAEGGVDSGIQATSAMSASRSLHRVPKVVFYPYFFAILPGV